MQDRIKYLKELKINEDYINSYINNENKSSDLEIKINDVLNIEFENLRDNTFEDFRNVLVLKSSDYSILIIAIIDKLVFLQQNKKEVIENKEKIAEIILNVYAPLAHRLGIYSVKTELEELCLYYIHNEIYMSIVKQLELKKEKREKIINKNINNINELLNNNIKEYKTLGRSKSIYSIYKKIIQKNKNIDELYDLYALRIICNDIVECYTILGIIHNNFEIIEDRFKDYIAVKKPNLYQSLHTAVKDSEDNILEIQIRTKEMDDIAEKGVAAHWLYKEKGNKNSEIVESLHLFRDNENPNTDIFNTRIYTYTPNKKIIQLPTDATIIDFAFSIHSKVAEQMIGALVNGKIAKINTKLKNDDVIEIKTKKNNMSVNDEWLKYAKTERARKKINAILRKIDDDNVKDSIISGKEKLSEYLKEVNKDINDEQLKFRLLRYFKLTRSNELFIEIDNNNITKEEVLEYFTEKKQEIKLVDYKTKAETENINVIGAKGIKKQIAKCCNPIPGDDILGVIVTGVGIKIHRSNCHNILNKENINVVNATFNENDKDSKYMTILEILSTNRSNILTDIISVITRHKAVMNKVDSREKNYNATTRLHLYVENLTQVEEIIVSLENVKGVVNITRKIQ